MKKLTLLLLALTLLYTVGISQQVINKPRISATTAPKLVIDKILLSDTSTIFYISAFYNPGNWFRFSPATYITDSKSKEKLVVRAASGIELGKEKYIPESGSASFTLSFPAVKSGTARVDLIECEDDGCFKIFDIELIASKKTSIAPIDLTGNWFKADGSKEWELSMMDVNALYKNKLWNYGPVKSQGKMTIVSLINGKHRKTLYFEKEANGTYKIGDQLGKLVRMSNEEIEHKGYKPDDKGFSLPILKKDSATYMGYFKGYSQKLGYKTGQVFVDNIITSQQESYLVSINPDGTFMARFPMNYPQGVFVRFPGYNETVYCEPGKTVFQFTDLGNGAQKTLYMGQSATLNREMLALDPKITVDYGAATKLSKGTTPDEHKAIFDKVETEKTAALNEYNKLNPLSKKGYQMAAMEIKYRIANIKADYNQFRSQNENKDNPDESKEVELAPSYYNFLDALPINNELSLVSNNYNSLINRIKYADFLFKQNPEDNSISAEETMGILLQKGEVKSKDIQFVSEFINKEKGDDKEKSLAAFNSKYPATKINDFVKEYEAVFNSTANGIFKNRRLEKLKKAYHLNDGLVLNIMAAQDYSSELERNYIPFTEKKMAEIKSETSNPFMYATLATLNEETKSKIAGNKLKTGYTINEVDKSDKDSLFTSIMKKFKGKPVYLDFWATWCGPCRSGIQQIAPLKDEMEKENVAFVYITNQSSPAETYKNMIADIKGEHFRLTNDEWNILSSKFKISGIPHYVLVDKNGEVVNPNLPHLGNAEIKKKLQELMN